LSLYYHNVIIVYVVIVILVCTALYKGIFILFGTSSSPSIISFSRTFHLPYVTLGLAGGTGPGWGGTPTPPTTNTTPQMRQSETPDSSTYSTIGGGGEQFSLQMRPVTDGAVLDVIRYYGWRRIVFLYDNIEGRWRKSLYIRKLRKRKYTERHFGCV